MALPPPIRPPGPVPLLPHARRAAALGLPEPAPKRRGRVRRYFDVFRDPEVRVGPKLVHGILGLIVGLSTVALVGTVVLGAYIAYLLPTLPDGARLGRAAAAHPSVVLDANGERLTTFDPPFRAFVPLDSIPTHVVDALLATEDRRFYEHLGVDVRRTAAATFRTLTGDREGGSSITQQLARNLFPEEIGRAWTVERKLKEAVTAFKIERRHTKRDILEAYLNTVPFLYNAFGIERAARTYFSKPAFELNVAEGATLIAMLKGNAYYNPVRNPDRALARRNLVLRLMAENGSLTTAEAERWQAAPLGVRFAPQPASQSLAPHFTAAVRTRMEEWAASRGYDLAADGLVFRTTLDLSMQREAEAAVAQQAVRLQRTASGEWGRGYWAGRRRTVEAQIRGTPEFDAAVANGASEEDAVSSLRGDEAFMDSLHAEVTRIEVGLVALDPETGDVRAWVGSRDFAQEEYDHVEVARRQPGSAFKAVVYAAALQRGYSPLDRVRDEAITVDMGNGEVWRPTNSGRISGAEITLADALAYSKNTIAVRLMSEIGPARIAALARRMGITDSPIQVVPALALGASEVSLLEMTSVYGTIANDGLRREPRLVTRVETARGDLIEAFGSTGEQALTQREARTLLDMLRGVITRGTGAGLRLFGVTGDVAGKTGTTQRNADGWFIAMRPGLVTGAWVGFNDQRIAFRSNQAGQGSRTALPVVGDFLARVQDRLPGGRFPDPPGYREPFYDSLAAQYDGDEYDPFYSGYPPLEGMDPSDYGQLDPYGLPEDDAAYDPQRGYDDLGGTPRRGALSDERNAPVTRDPPAYDDLGTSPRGAPPPRTESQRSEPTRDPYRVPGGGVRPAPSPEPPPVRERGRVGWGQDAPPPPPEPEQEEPDRARVGWGRDD